MEIINHQRSLLLITLQPSSPITLINLINWTGFWIILSLIPGSLLRNACPQRSLIKPCSCQEKSKGFDILCEGLFIATYKPSINPINFPQSFGFFT
uniref:Uncharacterized protein n=1 Tax=Tetranychus urticae TaxID=32264 RepID=T1KJG5_TETUR